MPEQQGKQVVVITGASSGIGRALALDLGAAGYRLGLIARRETELEAVAATIVASGGEAVAAPADVGDRAALHAAIRLVEQQLGPVERDGRQRRIRSANAARPAEYWRMSSKRSA